MRWVSNILGLDSWEDCKNILRFLSLVGNHELCGWDCALERGQGTCYLFMLLVSGLCSN
jgi:hypothetical protein